MNQIYFRTSADLTKTFTGSQDLDEGTLEERIRQAVIDGVVDCGGYDTDIQDADENYLTVYASGTVEVSIEDLVDEAIDAICDEHEVDRLDADILDVSIDTGWYGATLEAEIEATATHEYESNSTVADFASLVVGLWVNMPSEKQSDFDRLVMLVTGMGVDEWMEVTG